MDKSERAKFIQRRWKEVVEDLAIQHGIDAETLFQKIPAFAAGELTSVDFKKLSKEELKVLKAAADTMAEVIFSVLPERSQSVRKTSTTSFPIS